MKFGKEMLSAAHKYTTTLAKVVACCVIASIVLLPVQSEMTVGFQVFVLIPLCLTMPVSLVWIIVAAVNKEWKSARFLALGFFLPVLAFIAFTITNWRILHTG